MYPKCADSFRQWYTSHPKWELFYKYLGKPKPFDVTLRDGLQGLSFSQQSKFTLEQKKELYHNIIRRHNPEYMEIGSIVSEKLLPIFKDSIDFHKYVERQQRMENKKVPIEFFVLVPNQRKLQKIVNNYLIHNFSFVTSVSNSFHLKNTKMTLKDGDADIDNMITLLNINNERCKDAKIKLYISCINYCPFEGIIDNDYIVQRLLQLNKKKVDLLCLSDTCGRLTCDDFEYIIDTCFYFGIPYSKFALHLHVNYGKEMEVEKIIHMALDRKIINFDVSLLDSGGCSITIPKENLVPNLSYELYYKSIVNYIKRKT